MVLYCGVVKSSAARGCLGAALYMSSTLRPLRVSTLPPGKWLICGAPFEQEDMADGILSQRLYNILRKN